MTGLFVLLGALVLATAIGFLQRAVAGRVRRRRAVAAPAPLPGRVADALDPDAAVTLVQLSTTFCAPCRHTRALLSAVAAGTPGLHHADLDVTDTPEVATGLGVFRTPTTLAYSADGRELLRVSGVPRKADLLDALRPHLDVAANAG
jgi:thiol-disulfide isomerase/thioredoxin